MYERKALRNSIIDHMSESYLCFHRESLTKVELETLTAVNRGYNTVDSLVLFMGLNSNLIHGRLRRLEKARFLGCIKVDGMKIYFVTQKAFTGNMLDQTGISLKL
jgi:hypothetical protein